MKFIIYGKPIPKQRARFSRRYNFVVTYDGQEREKRAVQLQLSLQLKEYANSTDKQTAIELGKISCAQAFSIKFIFFLPINQSDSVIAGNKKLWGITRANTKPDYDNLEKFYLDCANGILWADDAAVIKAQAIKVYSDVPRVEIVIEPIKDIKLNEKAEKVLTTFSPQEFKNLQQQAKKIAEIDDSVLGQIEGSYLQEWLLHTAVLLNEFALDYSGKLSKIAKLGDIKHEVDKLEKYKQAL